MKLHVNFELCEANALCVRACPEVFSLDAQDYLQVREEAVTEALRTKLQRACDMCPRSALELVG